MKRRDTHRKGYRSHDFTEAEDARILELRAQGLNRSRVAKEMCIAYYATAIRVTMLETLAREPEAKVRICIRPSCTTEFVSLSAGHRVCNGCRCHEDRSCEPFGNFMVTV